MNGRLERGMLMTGVLVLAASLQFGAGLLGSAASLLAALLLGAAATFLWLNLELAHRRPWFPVLALTLTSLIAVLIVELTFRPSFATWFSPLLTAGASGATLFVLLRSRARCNLCNRRLGTQAVVFRCPRCSMKVCDETCWRFEHRRCRLCLEQRVPVLPPGESWWTRVTGPRSRHGRCQICLGSAEQLDLRACPHCRRTQCRDCWDFNNGECARCAGVLPELPASLTMAVAQVSGGGAEPLAR